MAGTRPTPRADDLDLLARLREALQAADFTVERVESELATTELSIRAVDAAAYRRRLDLDGRFAPLARLFLLGDAIESDELRPSLDPLGVEGLIALRLCTIAGSRVQATVKLAPHGDYYVASDAEEPAAAETPFDYVPGVQAPSVTLAKLAVRREIGAALDLGTGSGLQALLAAKHSEHVVATDVNPRALAFAAFNSRLNGLDNVELRLGTSFEPVEDEQFDLIVSNPPYVISPDHTYAYRDSELPGDELCRSIVRAIPAHLREGGFAHVLVSWAVAGDWDAPLREWVNSDGCDAWLLHYRTSDPIAHAVGWLRPLGEADPEAFGTALDRWLAYLHQREIGAIAYGAVVLRRRAGGRNWIRTEELPLEHLEPASAHTLRVFDANDFLNGLADDRELLAQRLALTEHHRLRQTLACRPGGVEVEEAALELADGLRFSVGLDRYTTLLLPNLDGTKPLAEALAATAERIDLTEAGREQFVPAALPAVRRLLELGFLMREDT